MISEPKLKPKFHFYEKLVTKTHFKKLKLLCEHINVAIKDELKYNDKNQQTKNRHLLGNLGR